jgi:hypothetical protein
LATNPSKDDEGKSIVYCKLAIKGRMKEDLWRYLYNYFLDILVQFASKTFKIDIIIIQRCQAIEDLYEHSRFMIFNSFYIDQYHSNLFITKTTKQFNSHY